MKLEGRIRTTGETRVVTAEQPTYAAAKAAIDGQIGEGEQLLAYRTIEG